MGKKITKTKPKKNTNTKNATGKTSVKTTASKSVKKSSVKTTASKSVKKPSVKKTASKKSVPKKVTAGAAAKKSAPKKSTKSTKKKITLKDLIFKKFDAWKPEKQFKVETDKDTLPAKAPPFIEDTSADAERIREKLFRRFDPETMRLQIEEMKAEAERKAAEAKAAAERKAAEKKAAEEKAAQEKAAAEKKAAEEKAAREKAEAEKKAAERKAAEAKAAAARKAAAEKKAAEEKAAKEKAAAEKRAALERVAAEKAAAEKAAAKQEADEKKALEMKRNIIAAGAGFALILMMLIGVSLSNRSNFYVKPVEAGIEIQRGAFAPIGKNKYLLLQGIELQEPVQDVYSKKDLYPLIFDYYITQAESLPEAQIIPDFDEIEYNLKTALTYALTGEQRAIAKNHLNRIDFIMLVYKADIAAAKSDLSILETAINYYKKAAELNPAEYQARHLDRNIESVLQKIFLLEQKAAIEMEEDEMEEDGIEEQIPAAEDMPEAPAH